MYDYQGLVERVLDPKGTSGKDIIYACPTCEDPVKGHHLQVNYDKGFFHCFKCGLRGRNLSRLLKLLNVDVNYDYETVESDYEKELDNFLKESSDNVVKKCVDYSVNLKTLTEFYNYHTTDLSISAKNYLHNRGVSDYFISVYNIKEGLNLYNKELTINGKIYKGKDYSGRILIPSLRSDNLISFYVARDYTGMSNPKYLNPPKDLAYSSEDVWNLDILDTNYVIICEGVMTAMAVDMALNKRCSVATYGKSISSKSNSDNKNISVTSQGEKLINKKLDTYFVFYDYDAKDEAFKTMKYLYDRGLDVRYVSIDGGKHGAKADAADMSGDEVINCIRNSRKYDKFLEFEGQI